MSQVSFIVQRIILQLSNQHFLVDSCSSAFGSRKSKRTIEFVYESTSTEPTETTILPTTIKLTNDIMTYNEEHKTPKTRKSDEKLIEEYRDHLELCEGIHALELCLNGGTCKVLKRHQLYLCVCADDFTGKRCEEKSLEGTYGGGMIVRKSRITETIAPSADSTYVKFVFSRLSCLVEVL